MMAHLYRLLTECSNGLNVVAGGFVPGELIYNVIKLIKVQYFNHNLSIIPPVSNSKQI